LQSQLEVVPGVEMPELAAALSLQIVTAKN
jgi:hypothetical protein